VGHVQGENMMAACTNPPSLGGGSAPLHAYLATDGRSITGTLTQPRPWVNPPTPIATRFVTMPQLLTAQCVNNDHGSYLEVTVHGLPGGSRADDIVGDVITNGQVNAVWGLHAID